MRSALNATRLQLCPVLLGLGRHGGQLLHVPAAEVLQLGAERVLQLREPRRRRLALRRQLRLKALDVLCSRLRLAATPHAQHAGSGGQPVGGTE